MNGMADIKAEIDAANARFEELMRTKNTKGLSDLYANDIKVMPPGAPTISGKDACIKMMEGFIASGCTGGRLTAEEIGPCDGNTVWERGKYTFFKEGDAVLDTGKYLVIWQREDGKLKLLNNIWNSGN